MTTKITTINMLILDPSSNDAEQTINILRNNGHAVRATQITSEEELDTALEKQSWDIFIVRDGIKKPTAEQCLQVVQHYGRDIPFIMTSKNHSIARTIEAIKLGMKDVVPDDNDEYFKLVFERELGHIEDRLGRKYADKALRETDKRNELLLDSSRDAIAYIIDGMHIYVNNAYMELFGYDDADDFECLPIMDLMDSGYPAQFKNYIKQRNKGEATDEFPFKGLTSTGSSFKAFLSMTDSEYDGESCTQVFIKTADTNDEELNKKLKELSAQDRLTGLFNQEHFIEVISEAIENASDNEKFSALLYIELDNYDDIRDKHGRTQGDEYIKQVSLWLTENSPNSSQLARLGDSTFSILTETSRPEQIKEITSELCKKFAEQLFEISSQTVKDSLSIGICPIQETSQDAEKILSNAHFAASSILSKDGNGYRLHDASLDQLDNRDDAQTDMAIQDAWDADKIHVQYQPIVKLHGSVERMFHARLTIEIEQGEIKGIAEAFDIGLKTSTALKLDQWLMKDAFAFFKTYIDEHSECKLKLTLSTASLLEENLVNNLLSLLDEFQLPKDSVIFEFREEDAVTHLKRAIQVVHEMGKQELISALSGFGSTLDSEAIVNSINTLGFMWLSFDPALMTNFIGNSDSQTKIQELSTFAKVNELSTITPGVDDAGTLATIWPMSIAQIHGEYIGLEAENFDFDFSEAVF